MDFSGIATEGKGATKVSSKFRANKSYPYAERTPEFQLHVCWQFKYNNEKGLDRKAFALQNNIPPSTFGDWWNKFKEDEEKAYYQFKEFSRGGQSKFDSIAVETVSKLIIKRQNDCDAVTKEKFDKIMNEVAVETSDRRGNPISSTIVGRTAKKTLEKCVGFSVVKPQTKTNARKVAWFGGN